MRVRLATSADDQSLLALWNRAATYDPMSKQLFQEKVHGDPDATTLVAEADGQAIGFATLVARHLTDEVRGIIKLIAVEPAFQRTGVGSTLLNEAERELAQRGATAIRVGESFPNYLTPGVDLRYAAALAFFASHGYALLAEAVNLEVDLGAWQATHQEPRSLPNGVNIRRATPDDMPAIAVLISTHWPPWWGEVSQALVNDPATLFLAWQGETVLGFAAHDANNRSTGWFGPMGTAPEARGKGIGVALLHAALEDMSESDYRHATIPWVGPVEFYERHAGATLSRTFQRFHKSLPTPTE